MEICKVSPLAPPNQPLIRSKDLAGCIYETFKPFWRTNEYNEIGCLFLMLLDKAVKAKDELRDSNSQLKCHINDLKASMCALQENLISCS